MAVNNSLAPRSALVLKKRLARLRKKRGDRTKELRKSRPNRRSLTARRRAEVLAKTASRCHICGVKIKRSDKWEADHVQPHSDGGSNAIDNYLASCRLCNNYRRHLLPDELQIVIKLGVFARAQIERGTKLGNELAEKYVRKEKQRVRR